MTQPGVQTGNYVLLERVGMGGMAEVFRAASVGVEGFERPVAIKRILPNLAADEDFVKMFVDEAKIAVQLQHPNIVEIFDLAREEDDLFIAMEYVHGKDLRAILDKVQGHDGRGARIPIEIAVHVTMKVCEALHHAHFAHGPSGQPLGIIHRDISPQNVIVSYDGDVKVTDFGLAKAAGRAVQTQAGVVKGKLAYMSPEQLRGLPIDQRSDVYGVGILLWEMLTGVRLFLGKNDQETLRRVYHAQIPSPRSIRPDLHPELEAIVLRSLEREVDARYGTAELMQEDLTGFMYTVGPAIGTPGIGAFMRALYPGADPAPAPSSHPPARTARRGPSRLRTSASPTRPPAGPGRPRRRRRTPRLRVGPPRSRASPSAPPVVARRSRSTIWRISSICRRSSRADTSRVSPAPSSPTRAASSSARSCTGRSRPPPPRPSLRRGPTTTGRRRRTAASSCARRRSRSSCRRRTSHASSRRPGAASPGPAGSVRGGGSGPLSAPRMPSIEALIEEALSGAMDAVEPLEQQERYGEEPYGQGHEHSIETDEFGDHPTMVGDEDELANATHSWDGDDTPLNDQRRR